MPERRRAAADPTTTPDYRPPPGLLTGRVVLVTGAAGGIGRPLSLACARLGATVLLLDRRERDLEELHDRIVTMSDVGTAPPAPVIVATDLATLDERHAGLIADQVGDSFGALHGIVFAAAAAAPLAPLEHCSPRTWAGVLSVNLTSTWLLLRALLPALRRAATASVVLSAHGAARTGEAYWGPTAVAAGGLDALCAVLADELAANTRVRINALDPGPVRTASRIAQFPGLPADRWRPVEEVLPAYLWLLGDDSAGVSGRRLSVAGSDARRAGP